MPNFGFLLKVSRTRFWIYIFGPFLIGLAAGASSRADFLSERTIIFALYFLFPANLLIYGINDIFDYETDKLNTKKQDYELLVQPAQRQSLIFWILITNLPFLIALFFISFESIPAMVGFLFFSIFYSAPPIRAKTKPFLDSAFNILYVFPGIFAFHLVSGDYPPVLTVFAAACWTFAMHAYSAVPDIHADQRAQIKTVATQLGANGTLALCLILYMTASFLVFQYLHIFSLIFSAVYLVMITISFYFNKKGDLFKVYKFFPLINAVVGFTLFWFIAYSKLI